MSVVYFDQHLGVAHTFSMFLLFLPDFDAKITKMSIFALFQNASGHKPTGVFNIIFNVTEFVLLSSRIFIISISMSHVFLYFTPISLTNTSFIILGRNLEFIQGILDRYSLSTFVFTENRL